MATVVVVLPVTARVSSMPILRSVSGSSVRSGRISLITPTIVVLPTPKPPAMRILAVDGTYPPFTLIVPLKRFESIEHHPQQALASRWLFLGGVNPDQSLADEVTEQNAYHPEGQVDFRGQVDDRGGMTAQAQDLPVFGSRPEVLGRPFAGRRDDIDQVE